MHISAFPGDIPISSSGEVRGTTGGGEVQAPDAATAHLDIGGQITVETPDYFVADTVGHIVDTIV